MKINKLVITIFFSAVGLFVSTALQAQEAKTLFVNMPDSLSPLLTKVNREDCIDFLESKMKAQVENRFGKKSEMTDLSKDYIRMQMSAQSTWQMKVLALNDSTNVICTVSTVCAPACDSSIHFYTDDWKPLTTSLFITLPLMDDFLNAPDSAGVYEFDEARRSADMLLMKADFNKENTELTPHIPAERKFKIYVSALTTISLDDHNWIPTTDNRLLRRIIRDFNYRGYSARETISRWPSVRAGEDKWIFPYQENADVMFNSALLFEFAVLRLHAEPILMGVPRNCPEYCEAYRLLKFIKYFVPVQDKEIPPTSLLREFLGGSSFKY